MFIAMINVHVKTDSIDAFTKVSLENARSTAHYARWRDSVANMMAEPRQRTTYNFVFPAE
jgi:quinol monooxygenase YgiN